MFLRLSSRAAPAALLTLSGLWMAAAISLLLYSVLFPNADIRHIVESLKGRETLRGDAVPLVDQVSSVVGRLKRAMPVGAYWGGSAEFKIGESHTTKIIEIYYLAWFERRSGPTILIIRRIEEDRSSLSFYIREGTLFGASRMYLLPAFLMALSIYWFKLKRSPKVPVGAAGGDPTV